jgi:hypothetical protein
MATAAAAAQITPAAAAQQSRAANKSVSTSNSRQQQADWHAIAYAPRAVLPWGPKGRSGLLQLRAGASYVVALRRAVGHRASHITVPYEQLHTTLKP